MSKIEAGRLSASDLEHPDLQPLLLPRDTFDGKGSRLPGAVVKNPGGGKQKHWATCWVVERKAKYVAASGEVRAAADTPRPSPKAHRSPLTTAHHLTTSMLTINIIAPPPFTASTSACPPPICSPPIAICRRCRRQQPRRSFAGWWRGRTAFCPSEQAWQSMRRRSRRR